MIFSTHPISSDVYRKIDHLFIAPIADGTKTHPKGHKFAGFGPVSLNSQPWFGSRGHDHLMHSAPSRSRRGKSRPP
jgi:hypothetical protein